jgi:hypothetical protein
MQGLFNARQAEYSSGEAAGKGRPAERNNKKG